MRKCTSFIRHHFTCVGISLESKGARTDYLVALLVISPLLFAHVLTFYCANKANAGLYLLNLVINSSLQCHLKR